MPSELVREVAAHVLEQLRCAERLKVWQLDAAGYSQITVRRALEWLGVLGCPLDITSTSSGGARLTDVTWQIPAHEMPRVAMLGELERLRAGAPLEMRVEVRQAPIAETATDDLIAELERRGCTSVPRDLTDWLEAATDGDLLEQLRARGWAWSGMVRRVNPNDGALATGEQRRCAG